MTLEWSVRLQPGDPSGPGADPSRSPREVRAYLSDMLSQLADLARGLGDHRLEVAMRVLAVEAAAPGRDAH